MKPIVGLTTRVAESLMRTHGQNEIQTKRGSTPLEMLVAQFKSVLVILLIVASIASIVLGDVLDGVFIMAIVILNGVLGFIQEHKAEKAIEALKIMTISVVRVVRDGNEQKIDSKFLVPGDIVMLEEGDKVPADCTLIDSLHLEVNESSLTGESMPVEKEYDEAGKQEIYLGTIVVKGRTRALVTATGMQTRFGTIAASLSAIREEETPLQKKLDVLGRQLGIMALVASGMVFVIGIVGGHKLIELVLTSISLAVAAVPEGLPAVITITLAVGMQRMSRKKAILRKLSSIEALGSTTVIATDKTGTLTRNQMHVGKMWLGGAVFRSSDKLSGSSADIFQTLLVTGILCNNASIVFTHNNRGYDILGDTTEGALLLLARDKGVIAEDVKAKGVLLEEFAFDPVVKMMTVIWKHANGARVHTKGAPESVIARSTHIVEGDGVVALTATKRTEIESDFRTFAKEGLRLIALAYRDIRGIPKHRSEAEDKLIFIGFVGIADPPRPEVKEAIALASSAGIRTIMITGDNELTANAIGTHIGLIKHGDEIVTGKQFADMTDSEVKKRLPNIRIFARTTPDQKLRIVQLLQQSGHVVAVTGDGVNDALALKQSDVGVSMGITGTDVAKEASDMILVDDNYATLVTAVEEGRTIFDNIKSAVKYLVGCNVGEVVAVVVGMLLGWPLILTPLQLLYINLVTDGLPAIALAVTPKHDGIMKRKPRTSKQIFDTVDLRWFAEVSLLTAVATLVAFYIGNMTGGIATARAYAFTTIILVQQMILLDVWMRDQSIMHFNLRTNATFLLAFFGAFVLQLCILYIPAITKLFGVAAVTPAQLGGIALLSLTLLGASEIRKAWFLRVGNASTAVT